METEIENRVFDKYVSIVDGIEPIKYAGVVKNCTAHIVESEGPQVVINEMCEIQSLRTNKKYVAEVIGFHENMVKLMSYEDVQHIESGSLVVAMGHPLSIPVGEELMGRVINCLGEPIDGGPPISTATKKSIFNKTPNVLTRKRIKERIYTGVKAIDFFAPIGKGQRMGLFAGSSVGKSTLLGMVARNVTSDINVIALIGERGREVRDFIEDSLGEEGLKKSIIIVSTSDETPLSQVRGAYAATTIAEYFRDKGNDVMLFFDSVTRLAMASREIGLANGEIAASRGYTPSVFAMLKQLLERCSTSEFGTITGFYSVLVEGDDFDEPITDAVRAIIDGQIVLSRKIAQRFHYPAIDVLASLSRLQSAIVSKEHLSAAGKLRTLLSVYEDRKDLIDVGAYVKGSDTLTDEAISKIDYINKFLKQDIYENIEINDIYKTTSKLSGIKIAL